MTGPPRDLNRIQRWMYSVITHPNGVVGGIESDQARSQIDVAPKDVERVITPSRALSGIERIQIYANAYYARLLECLSDEFPAVVHIVGKDAFAGFAFGYLQVYPSQSYTLTELGANFPRYLEESRPEDESDGGLSDWSDFLIDLAKLERIYSEVFDGPGVEGETLLQTEDLSNIPPERWNDVRLVPVVCLRLETFRFPVHEYATAVRLGAQAAISPAAKTRLAIFRRDYIVRRVRLSETQYELLSALVEGHTLGAAIGRAVETTAAHVDELAAGLLEWFKGWSAAGLFQRVELPG